MCNASISFRFIALAYIHTCIYASVVNSCRDQWMSYIHFFNVEVFFRFHKTVSGVYLRVTCVQHPQQQPHVNICTHVYIQVYMLQCSGFRALRHVLTQVLCAAPIVQHPRSLIFDKMSIRVCKYMSPLTAVCAAH